MPRFGSGDRASLSEIISDDVVHIHGTGAVDDKAGYLAGIGGKYVFHTVTRGQLNIRVYGGFFVATGTLHQTFSDKATGKKFKVDGITSQTWINSDGRWFQNTCHNSFISTENIED